MRSLTVTATLAVLISACNGSDGQAQTDAPAKAAPASVETQPPNAPNQKPAFAGQTRAPAVTSQHAVKVIDYAVGLEKPWGMVFLPDGRLLVSEKPGRLRLVGGNGKLSPPLPGLPKVDARDQGGLLGLALDPAFASNGLVYFSYSERQADGSTNTAVGRARLVDAAVPRLEGAQAIWRQAPSLESTKHYGGRLVFGHDGTLFVTTGERSILPGRRQAQQLDSALGKIVRINADGSVPKDNPFVGRQGAKPEIYAIGVRNVQAAALNPRTGALWEVEHGARGGDEVNIIAAGKDYGWPTITYGIEYSGGPIGEGLTQKAGMEQPLYYWDPVIAPSGMAFYEADLFPAWKGSLLVGGLGVQRLVRLVLDGDKVVGEERLLADVGERIRDVVVGPDGAVYVATDSDSGRVLRLTPG